MRTKTVNFAGKEVTIREKKIKELNELADKLGVDFEDIIKSTSVKEATAACTDLLKGKIPVIFPSVTKDDIDEAYPSEIEELIEGFIDINFTGVKKVILPVVQLAQKRLSSSQRN
ncbi:MAG: hypothetical protein Q8936_01680 [Bacillota bacterium]|nr:hypothetical protein [Bacillota bacterium]